MDISIIVDVIAVFTFYSKMLCFSLNTLERTIFWASFVIFIISLTTLLESSVLCKSQ